ncbi:hypothetical protein GCM10010260_80960 [Streptomyces filipinensis]|uniref:Uncharacterized protein n=1 Tax=Streptomyces filipinensis TaxID=66887 RepID=A0A918MG70_9ACTN|nr:hypothetical protein GCM10010260_80960 [Streptomyces filipinensis]
MISAYAWPALRVRVLFATLRDGTFYEAKPMPRLTKDREAPSQQPASARPGPPDSSPAAVAEVAVGRAVRVAPLSPP